MSWQKVYLLLLTINVSLWSQIEAGLPPADVGPSEGGFATFFYDYGADSDALLLATRVLMRSITASKTQYRRLILIPEDGISSANREQFLKDDPAIEIVETNAPNVYKNAPLTDQKAQLLHMRNKQVIWEDPKISQLKRVVYLDPENVVIRNLDEIFACGPFCAVDNGQAVVYSNSLLVISPPSVTARNVYLDAIDSFMITGRDYNYLGITQGFLPGLFEALEESPLFYTEEEEAEQNLGAHRPNVTDAIVRRLPFYYSVNHMVFYERLNWDLYKCKDKDGGSEVPGPLLSFRYSGDMIKPWFWLPYVYFQVFWHWQQVRETLGEDHFVFFISQVLLSSLLFVAGWCLYCYLCLALQASSLDMPTSSILSDEVLNSRVVRKLFQVSCNVLQLAASSPILASALISLVVNIAAVKMVPPLIHPWYGGMLWLYLVILLEFSVLLIYDVNWKLRGMHADVDNKKWRGELSVRSLLRTTGKSAGRKVPLVLVFQLSFLHVVGRTDWFMNPVLRPVMLVIFFSFVVMSQTALFAQTIGKLNRPI